MRKIGDCFSSELQKIYTRTVAISQLNQTIKKYLSKELVDHCRVINLEKNCLTIALDNAIFATQLRYEIPDLLKKLRLAEQMPALCSIKQQVCPPLNNPTEHVTLTKKYPHITVKSYQAIEDTIIRCTDDTLRQALMKLSHTLQNIVQNN